MLAQSAESALIQQGQKAIQAEQYARAAQAFEAALKLSPESKSAYSGLLLAYLRDHRSADAVRVGAIAVQHWPQDPELAHYLGTAYMQAGDPSKAAVQLNRAARLAPHDYDTHYDLALVLLAQDQYQSAAFALEQAVRINPSAAIAHLLLGRAYQNTNKTIDAIEQFKTALHLDPKIPLGHYHLGFAYGSLGKNREATVEYETELRNGNADAEVYYQLAHLQIELGDLKSAVVNDRAAIARKPRADAFYDLGKSLALLGDREAARQALQQAVAMNPKDPSAHFQLARVLAQLNDASASAREMQIFTQLRKSQQSAGGMASGRQ